MLFSLFKILVLSAELSGIGHRVAASEKDLDNQSKEVATLKGALSTTETEVQHQKIIVQGLEKAAVGHVAPPRRLGTLTSEY